MNRQTLSRLYLIAALAVLLALTLPLLALAPCAVPAADDYSYGTQTHRAWQESGSVPAAVAAAGRTAVRTWHGWQGTFSAVFLMALQPAVFGERLYAITPYLMLASLFAGVFSLCLVLYGEVFRLGRESAATVAAVICGLCAALIPSAVQGLFWYNGAVYYVLFYGLWLIACALGIRVVRRGGALRTALLLLLAIVLGGGNYVTALSCAVVGIAAMLLMLLQRTPGRKRLLLPLAVFLAAFALSVAAPGNAVRQMSVRPGPGALAAIRLSFACAAAAVGEWTNGPLLAALLLLLPVLIPGAKRASKDFAFPWPAAVTLFSFCLLAAMFCPPLYGTGEIGELRLVNIVFFAFVFLAAGNLFYWLGWLARRMELRAPGERARALALLALAALALAGCWTWLRGGGSVSTAAAIDELRSGEGRAFRACADRRLTVLEDPRIRDAKLEPFPVSPWLLYYTDISEDPEEWINVSMAAYYGKDSVAFPGY